MTHSSTSNSDYHLHYHTPTISWRAALWLAIPLWMLALGVWEWFWRHQGYEPSYLNSVGLWADARRKVGTDGNRDLVIVGSSRILFDLDLNVLSEELDAPYPIQLALEGTNPYDFLHDIAVDPLFKGTLLVGVTEGLLFGRPGGERGDMLQRFQKQTPSDRMGHRISLLFEHHLGMLDPDLRLFTLIERMDWPDREGMPPRFLGVRKLSTMDRFRESTMWHRLETDLAYQKMAQDTWSTILSFPAPPLTDEHVTDVIGRIHSDVDLIRSRGGRVIFVRCPSNGHFLEVERQAFPRSRVWDRLIAETNAIGIHFEDYPQLQGYTLPEWSHLAAGEKERFTSALAKIIQEQKET
ncbi:MAG: hypothetical protein KDC35_18190 [Acidobacteria bacterium]|nr:hypothetical protein [Acidobacteriota bacterium]